MRYRVIEIDLYDFALLVNLCFSKYNTVDYGYVLARGIVMLPLVELLGAVACIIFGEDVQLHNWRPVDEIFLVVLTSLYMFSSHLLEGQGWI